MLLPPRHLNYQCCSNALPKAPYVSVSLHKALTRHFSKRSMAIYIYIYNIYVCVCMYVCVLMNETVSETKSLFTMIVALVDSYFIATE